MLFLQCRLWWVTSTCGLKLFHLQKFFFKKNPANVWIQHIGQEIWVHECKSVIHNWHYKVAIKVLEYLGIPQLGKTLYLSQCIICVMSTRKYTSVASTSRALLQYFCTTRDPWDHVTIPYTGQPTYHNIPLLSSSTQYPASQFTQLLSYFLACTIGHTLVATDFSCAVSSFGQSHQMKYFCHQCWKSVARNSNGYRAWL